MSTTVDLGKITASVTVGTTTTGAAGTNASVSNSGTTQDAVLNFTIPRGAQGVQGPQGSTGPQGPAGPTGPQGPMGDVAVITPEQQAAFTMYSETGQNTNGPMTQKAVTDNFVEIGDSGNDADLDIVDDLWGYILARFSNGHIMTKYFDSSRVGIITDNNNNADFSIDDENNYSIVQFVNGHVKTKYFDSSKTKYANYGDYQRRIFFTHTVNCVNWLDTSFDAAEINTTEDIDEYSDNCVLYLPNSYTKIGEPCKLIIYCKHGASTIEPSADDILTGSMGKYFRYMLSLGYAIVAADGVPNAWASSIGVMEQVCGNYVAVQSTIKAYEYVTDNYNINKDNVMVFGWSQGGAYALNLIENTSIPIAAAALISPVTSFKYHLWDFDGNVVIDGVTYTKRARLNIARIFSWPSFTTNAQLLALEYDYMKTSGFDPWFRNVEGMYTDFVQSGYLWKLPSGASLDDITMKKHLRCPVKVWVAENDTTLSCDVTKVFVKALKNAGVSADIEVKSTGGHDIVSQQSSVGTFIENGESVNLYPMAKDVASWFNINGGY